MAKAIAVYEGGIHNRIEKAVREDGQMFERHQEKTRFGYRWSAWRRFGEPLGDNARKNLETSMSAGFSTLYLITPDNPYWRNVRLPG